MLKIKKNSYKFGFSLLVIGSVFIANASLMNNITQTNLKVEYQDWTIEQISAGFDYYLLWAKDDQGNDHVYTWGENDYGQLGDGTTTANYTPTEISYAGNDQMPNGYAIQEISVAGSNTMISFTDASGIYYVYGWGKNDNGNLGIGNKNAIVSTPTETSINFTSSQKVTDIVTSDNDSFVSVVNTSTEKNNIYGAGSNTAGSLGINNTTDHNSFVNINYTNIPNDDSYTIKGLYSNDSPYNSAVANYILITDNDGYDHLYGAGEDDPDYASFAGQFPPESSQDNLKVFTELTNYPEPYDSNALHIKSFYTSYSGSDYVVGNKYGSSYEGITLTDDQGQDHLYTFGINSGGNIGNGEHSDTLNGVQITMQEVDFSSTGIGEGYTIVTTGGDYYGTYAVLLDSNGKQHIYFWGNDPYTGISTYEDPNTSGAESDYLGQYFTTPKEINYPEGLDLSTWSVKNMGFSYTAGYLLVEENSDPSNQTLYMWGDNSNNIISSGKIDNVYTPLPVYSTINPMIDNFNLTFENDQLIIDFNVIGTWITIDKLTLINQSNNQTQEFSADEFTITNDGLELNYNLSVDGFSEKNDYKVTASFENTYFDFNTTISGEKNLGEYKYSSYIWLIVLFSTIVLVIIALAIALVIFSKRQKKQSGKMSGTLDNYN